MISLFKKSFPILVCTALMNFSGQDVTLRTFSIEVMPDGCGNPFADNSAFLSFFESTLHHMAARRGPTGAGVVDLFAVMELRSELDTLEPNPQQEGPLDRLIVSQLCQFQKIQTKNYGSGKAAGSPLKIESSDVNLHNHLASLASKLYKDARKITLEYILAREKNKKDQDFLLSKWADVRRAKELAHDKVRDLFDKEE